MIIHENDFDASLLDYLFKSPNGEPLPELTDEDLAALGELFPEDE